MIRFNFLYLTFNLILPKWGIQLKANMKNGIIMDEKYHPWEKIKLTTAK